MIFCQQPLVKRRRNIRDYFSPHPDGTLFGPTCGNIVEVDGVHGRARDSQECLGDLFAGFAREMM
jgi:hypothetical protein